MEATTTGVATTDAATKLAILQAYPLGTLDVEVMVWPAGPARPPAWIPGKLIGLIEGPKPAYVRIQTSGQSQIAQWPLAEVRVFLRLFSALTQQLPDGTVPLLKIAQIAHGARAKWFNWPTALIDAQAGPGGTVGYFAVVAERLPDIISGPSISFDINAGWDFNTTGWAASQCRIFDYLRSQKFALPINGKPLLEGTDFIAL